MRRSGVLEIAKSDSRKKGTALEDKFSEPLCQQLRLKYFNTLVIICAPHATWYSTLGRDHACGPGSRATGILPAILLQGVSEGANEMIFTLRRLGGLRAAVGMAQTVKGFKFQAQLLFGNIVYTLNPKTPAIKLNKLPALDPDGPTSYPSLSEPSLCTRRWNGLTQSLRNLSSMMEVCHCQHHLLLLRSNSAASWSHCVWVFELWRSPQHMLLRIQATCLVQSNTNKQANTSELNQRKQMLAQPNKRMLTCCYRLNNIGQKL